MPNQTVSDNAHVYCGRKWITINHKYCIEAVKSPSYHQSSNYDEEEGGNWKYWLVKLFHNTPYAPLKYWYYGLDFLNSVDKFISKVSLNRRCPAEKVSGETPDMSCLCFPWFSPVWYYTPNLDFPTN